MALEYSKRNYPYTGALRLAAHPLPLNTTIF